ncbi:MAG TPA: Gfo/Idh/MocA family oxidoreductase, partial [Cyclobacteriaceae bacterium]|nr:Gfo/Idh/MocA family oxidoreductase [Cyclobacteriaceae bacterium]
MGNKKLKMGMIGGGPGSFIGGIHRNAAALDGLIELTAGTFSSQPEKSIQMGKELHLQQDRIYADYDELLEKESLLPEEERIDFVCIITPNHLHLDPAVKALKRGFHVVLDKPMTL